MFDPQQFLFEKPKKKIFDIQCLPYAEFFFVIIYMYIFQKLWQYKIGGQKEVDLLWRGSVNYGLSSLVNNCMWTIMLSTFVKISKFPVLGNTSLYIEY